MKKIFELEELIVSKIILESPTFRDFIVGELFEKIDKDDKGSVGGKPTEKLSKDYKGNEPYKKVDEVPLKWYRFHQNNSGGSFTRDNMVTKDVIIQAHSSNEANILAEEIGIYFNGCDKRMDCNCCGDRWSRAYENEGTEKPEIYGEEIEYSGSKESVKLNHDTILYPFGSIKL